MLTLSQTIPGFYVSAVQVFFKKNDVGKGEIARFEQFLLFPQCFQLFWENFCYFHFIQNCRLQTFVVWKSLKFVQGRILTDTIFYETFREVVGLKVIRPSLNHFCNPSDAH